MPSENLSNYRGSVGSLHGRNESHLPRQASVPYSQSGPSGSSSEGAEFGAEEPWSGEIERGASTRFSSQPENQGATHSFHGASGFNADRSTFNSVTGSYTDQRRYHSNPMHFPVVGSEDVRSSEIEEKDSELYARLLWPKGRGFPLWYPNPSNNLAPEYVKAGIQIGDVGIITSNGEFDFLFNICLPPDHPVNGNRVPDGFCPITKPDPRDINVDLEHHPGAFLMSKSITGRIKTQNQDEDVYSFQCTHRDGAILILPEGSSKEDLQNLGSFRRYASQNGESWYRYANGDQRGREAINGSIHLITGCDKCSAWTLGAFSHRNYLPSAGIELQFGASIERYNSTSSSELKYHYKWVYSGPGQVKYGPIPVPSTNNQSIFVRTFCIGLNNSIWTKLFAGGTNVHVKQNMDLTEQELGLQSKDVPFGDRGGSWYSWFKSSAGGRNSEAIDVEDGEGRNAVLITDFSEQSNAFHPSRFIIQYLLQKVPNANVAITHHDDWKLLINEKEEILPELDEMIRRLDMSYLTNTDDDINAVFLVPKDSLSNALRKFTTPSRVPSFSKSYTAFGKKDFKYSVSTIGSHISTTHDFIINEPTLVDNIQVNMIPNPEARIIEAACLAAGHQSAERFDPPKCHPETRVAIRQDIMSWVNEDDPKERVMWLNGPVGTGKSAIAQTIAEICSYEHKLISSFFFSRTGAANGMDDGTRLVPTIAYHLANSIPETKDAIFAEIDHDPSVLKRPMELQMEKIVVDPLVRLSATGVSNIPQRLVIIDGLDECSQPEFRSRILNLIAVVVVNPSIHLRFLIASRPEPDIRKAFDLPPLKDTYIRLTLDESYDPDKDIETYLQSEFSIIKREHALSAVLQHDDWPSYSDLRSLVHRSSGQFVYASTVMKIIKNGRRDPRDMLKSILNEGTDKIAAESPFEMLDELYKHILSAALAVVETKSYNDIYSIFEVLLYNQHRHSSESVFDVTDHTLQNIARLIGVTTRDVDTILSDLHSVMFVPDLNSPDEPIRFFHLSFSDFLKDPFRSKEFCVAKDKVHVAPGHHCRFSISKD